jgi:hypothetical protein
MDISALELPYNQLRVQLTSFAAALLSDMVMREAAAIEASDTWAQAANVALTEVLDQQLRHHRPRAGHIDDSLRREVSTGLLARRRKFDQFIASQVAAAKNQVESFEADKAQAEVVLAKSLERMTCYFKLMRQCQSRAAVDIRRREVQRLHSQTTAEIMDCTNTYLQKVHTSCDKLAEDISRCSSTSYRSSLD